MSEGQRFTSDSPTSLEIPYKSFLEHTHLELRRKFKRFDDDDYNRDFYGFLEDIAHLEYENYKAIEDWVSETGGGRVDIRWVLLYGNAQSLDAEQNVEWHEVHEDPPPQYIDVGTPTRWIKADIDCWVNFRIEIDQIDENIELVRRRGDVVTVIRTFTPRVVGNIFRDSDSTILQKGDELGVRPVGAGSIDSAELTVSLISIGRPSALLTPIVTGYALDSWTTFGTYTLSLDGSGAEEGDLLTIVLQHAYTPSGACGGDSEDIAQSVSGATKHHDSSTGGVGACRRIRFSVWTMTATQDHIDNGITYTGGNPRVSNFGRIACIPISNVSDFIVSADGPDTADANVGPVGGGIIVFGTRQATSGTATTSPTISPPRELIFTHGGDSSDESPRIRAWYTDDTANNIAGSSNQAAAAVQFGVNGAVT